MKKWIASFMLVLLTAYPLAVFGESSVEKDPAYLPIDEVLDLKTIRPEVDLNLPRFLLKDALSELNSSTNGSSIEGVDIADAIKDVKLIRVVVIEANQTNRAALDKAFKTLQSQLEKKWTTIVSVPEDKEHVGVYAMSDSAGESTTGLAVLVYDGSDAVIGNIVGHIAIGKLMKIASQSGKVPKDLLKKFQTLGNQTKESPGAKADGDPKSKDIAAPKAPAEDSAAK
ncbi:MAG TPA: DUF4252 domain-containing protein [Candidatus Limnocylindrales bacterium]|nr:DUF4252 domain-containing protein [Candidatus Limnocylindrales bacterium]